MMYLILDQSDFALGSMQFIIHPRVIQKRQCGQTSCLQRKYTIKQNTQQIIKNNLTLPLFFHGISNSYTSDTLIKWPHMHSMNLTENVMSDIHKSILLLYTYTNQVYNIKTTESCCDFSVAQWQSVHSGTRKLWVQTPVESYQRF